MEDELLVERSKPFAFDKEGIDVSAAKLSEIFSNINHELPIRDMIEQAEGKNEEIRAKYVDLSKTIKEEMFALLNQLNEKKIKSAQIEMELFNRSKEKNRYCLIYAQVPPLLEMKNDEEYDFFRSRYNEANSLNKEISEINLMIMHLAGIQKSLDHAYACSMIEAEYVVRRMEETLRTSKCLKNDSGWLENCKNERGFYKDLQKMIEEKNEEYSSVLSRLTKSLNKDELSLVGVSSVDGG